MADLAFDRIVIPEMVRLLIAVSGIEPPDLIVKLLWGVDGRRRKAIMRPIIVSDTEVLHFSVSLASSGWAKAHSGDVTEPETKTEPEPEPELLRI